MLLLAMMVTDGMWTEIVQEAWIFFSDMRNFTKKGRGLGAIQKHARRGPPAWPTDETNGPQTTRTKEKSCTKGSAVKLIDNFSPFLLFCYMLIFHGFSAVTEFTTKRIHICVLLNDGWRVKCVTREKRDKDQVFPETFNEAKLWRMTWSLIRI